MPRDRAPNRGVALSIDVRVVWGDSDVYACTCRRPRELIVGDGPSCDFRVPETLLGTPRWKLVRVAADGAPWVHVPPRACFRVERCAVDGARASPYRRPGGVPFQDGSAHVPLDPGTSVSVLVGPLALIVSAFSRKPALTRPHIAPVVVRSHLLSLAAHLLVVPLLLVLSGSAPDPSEPRERPPYHFVRCGFPEPPEPPKQTPLMVHVPSTPPLSPGDSTHFYPEYPSITIGELVPTLEVHGSAPRLEPFGTDAPIYGPARGASRPRVDPSTTPTSSFAILPEGASDALLQLRKGGIPYIPDVSVEGLLYEMAPAPPNMIEGQGLRFLLDSMPSPAVDGREIVRIVVQAPDVGRKARRRLLLMEAGAPVSAVVAPLVRSLPERSAVSMMSFGQRVWVESSWSADRSDARIELVAGRVARRAPGRPPDLDGALASALDPACKGAADWAATDLVVIARNVDAVSARTEEAIELRRSSGACPGVRVSWMSLDAPCPARLRPFPNGRCWHVQDPRRHPELSRYGDSLAEPAALDVVVSVTFDPNSVGSYRLLGYEHARNPVPAWAVDTGTPRVSTIRPGEMLTALYEVERLRAGGIDVQVEYRIPGDRVARRVVLGLPPARAYPTVAAAPPDLRHAVGVAVFAEWLRGDCSTQICSLDMVERLASARTAKEAELATLVRSARSMIAGPEGGLLR